MPRLASLRWAVCLAAVVASFAGAEGTAIAQGDGVVVDPESPAGKEYALPLEAARRDGAGRGTASTGSASAPLFGAGISRRRNSPTLDGSDRRSRGGADSGRSDDASSDATDPTDATDARDSRAAAAAAIAEGGTEPSAGLLTALIAFGVLVVGGIVGLSLRALRRTEQHR